MAFQNCASCSSPAKCRAAGKCLNKKKTTKKMATPKSKPKNAERTTGGSYD